MAPARSRHLPGSVRRSAALLSLVAVAGVSAAVPSGALGAPGTLQRYEASVSPNRAGTKTRPATVGLNLRPFHENTIVTSQNGVLVGTGAFTEVPPFATMYGSIWFPRQIRWQTSHFRRCALSTVLAAPNSCPRSSEIGRTSSENYALGALRSNPEGRILLAPRLDVRIFNLGSSKIAIRVYSTSTGAVAMTGRLSTRMTASEKSNGFGSKLRITIPSGLISPGGNTVSQLSDFNAGLRRATVRYRGRTYRYAGLTGCPSSRRLNFAYRGDYNVGLQTDAQGNYVVNSRSPLIKIRSRCRPH